MQPSDIRIVADVVAEALKTALTPLQEEIATLKARTPEQGERGLQGEPGPRGADGANGKDAEPVDVGEIVGRVTALIPLPKDGRDGTNGKDAEPVDVEAIIATVSRGIRIPQDGARGQDGVGLSGALIDGEGNLQFTFTDGTTKNVGRVKGDPGRDGQQGLPGREVRGENGADGLDGLGFDDITVEYDGERAFSLAFHRGTRTKTFGAFTLPIAIYRGVWEEGTYQRGDQVTWNGSQFHALKETTAKPETSPDWRLCVKRGRDGRDGKVAK